MKHQGKAIEIIGSKEVLGKKIAWIKYLEDQSIREVSWIGARGFQKPDYHGGYSIDWL